MSSSPDRPSSRLPSTALAAYAVALAWGSLYPMSGWRDAGTPLLGFLLDPWPRWWTVADLVFNLIIYLPVGLLVALLLRQRGLRRATVPMALLAGSAAALGLEALQTLLPGRVPSRLDWLANSAGALIGALAAPLGDRLVSESQRALDARRAISPADSAAGILLLGAWLLIQWPGQRLLFGQGDLRPLLESLAGLGGLSADADPIAWRLAAAHTEFAEALGVAMSLVTVGLLVRELLPTRAPRSAITTGLVGVALLVKTAVAAEAGRPLAWLTAGAQGGLLAGAVLLALAASAPRKARLWMGLAALAVSSGCSTLFPLDAYFATALADRTGSGWRNLEGLLRGAAALWPWVTAAWCLRRLRALGPAPEPDHRPAGDHAAGRAADPQTDSGSGRADPPVPL
ncbi:MAG: VanZ family protein [Betaproteobacteria bacterium]|nr:VanZ family protein [Betaproteobacteria bacterium]